MRGDDDLQVVHQRELLQLQHQQLLHPRMQPGLYFIDKHQSIPQLSDLVRQPQDGPFASGHVQLRIGCAALLLGKEQVLRAAGELHHLRVAERQHPLGEIHL